MIGRRTLITAAASATAATAWSDAAGAADPVFRHGVASGDPLATRVVLWTRVTPTASTLPGSGQGPAVDVAWQVARDRAFTSVVGSGTVRTSAARDHTVKIDASGLRPGTVYFYRFRCAGATSPTGRTKTAPDGASERLRFGVVSCSNWEAGYFAAYRHLAARGDLDAILHLGDYIYEYGTGEYGAGDQTVRTTAPRHEIVTLADYRIRHASHKGDPDLRRLHAAYPMIVTWDDHESANEAWRGGAENHTPATEGSWAARKAASARAYDEWMPVRLAGTAALGDGTRLFRHLPFGGLADLTMLDLRSYRSKQLRAGDPGVADPTRTITGDAQMRFLTSRLAQSEATWKLVGNPVMITPVLFPSLDTEMTTAIAEATGLVLGEGLPYNVDQWDGYQADRRELLEHIRERGIPNVTFLTGDIHSGWACEIPERAGQYAATRRLGVELVCTSVTSDNVDDILGVPPRTASIAAESAILAANRHIKYVDLDSHGYSVLTLTPGQLRMDWHVLSDRRLAAAGSRWSRGYAVQAGTNTLVRTSGPAR